MKRKLTPARLQWKLWWRQLRIIRRETTKAWEDQMLFGTGYTQIGPDVPDGIRHIPLEQIRIMYAPK